MALDYLLLVAMVGVLIFQLCLWMVPWFWGASSLGREPYTWRRPVPGWRQSEESVTLENRGYHFEEAEFEAHFRDQGKGSLVCRR